jgi:hypothetical protein
VSQYPGQREGGYPGRPGGGEDGLFAGHVYRPPETPVLGEPQACEGILARETEPPPDSGDTGRTSQEVLSGRYAERIGPHRRPDSHR